MHERTDTSNYLNRLNKSEGLKKMENSIPP